jgi:hypothetical protein
VPSTPMTLSAAASAPSLTWTARQGRDGCFYDPVLICVQLFDENELADKRASSCVLPLHKALLRSVCFCGPSKAAGFHLFH